MSHNRPKIPKPGKNTKQLTVIQVNVRRGGPANDLALALGYKRDMNVIMIQEPWIGRELDRRMCKKHREYQAYASEDEWEERPRVIIYVRKRILV